MVEELKTEASSLIPSFFESNSTEMTQPKRMPGIDLLKLILAIMIVARHTALVSIAVPDGAFPKTSGDPYDTALLSIIVPPGAEWTIDPFVIGNLIYMNLQNLCVPLFMLISLWFFAKKRVDNPGYFKKRVCRLIQVIGFWWAIYALVGAFTSYDLFPKTIMGYIAIPFVDGAMYFLGALFIQVLFIELIVRICEKLSPKYELVILIGSLIIGVVIQLSLRDMMLNLPSIIGLIAKHGVPLFFSYGPAALILVKRSNLEALSIIGFIGSLAIILYWVDIYMLSGASYPGALAFFQIKYGTPHTVFIAAVIMLLFARTKRDNSQLVSTLSSLVLGIYLIHPIMVVFLKKYINIKQFYYVGEDGGAVASL